VDEKWAETFIVELRLIGVQGVRIGAALSEVESHCSETGRTLSRPSEPRSTTPADFSCRAIATIPR
jgi:hypothetical protein